jgi:hypothetical protein
MMNLYGKEKEGRDLQGHFELIVIEFAIALFSRING